MNGRPRDGIKFTNFEWSRKNRKAGGRHPLRQENFAAPFFYRLLPRNMKSALATDAFHFGKFNQHLLPLNLDARDMTPYEGPVVHWL